MTILKSTLYFNKDKYNLGHTTSASSAKVNSMNQQFWPKIISKKVKKY